MKTLVGCVSDANTSCPPACLLVQEGRRHVVHILGVKAKTAEINQNTNTELH